MIVRRQEHLKRDKGQSLAEYTLLISIVALGAIAAIVLFGNELSSTTNVMAMGNASTGGVTGGEAIKTPATSGLPLYNETYTGDLTAASTTDPAYDPASPQSPQMAFGLTDTICGTETGATPADRCQKLQGLPVTVTNPDGSTTTTNPDGSALTTYPDGTTTATAIDGSALTTYPDGTTTTTATDGSALTTYPDGTTTTTATDGSALTTYPDGTTTETATDGSTLTTHPDGTTETASYDASGVGYTLKVNPDGSSVRVETSLDPTTGNLITVTTHTDINGNVTVS